MCISEIDDQFWNDRLAVNQFAFSNGKYQNFKAGSNLLSHRYVEFLLNQESCRNDAGNKLRPVVCFVDVDARTWMAICISLAVSITVTVAVIIKLHCSCAMMKLTNCDYDEADSADASVETT